jgi:signal peptidase I
MKKNISKKFVITITLTILSMFAFYVTIKVFSPISIHVAKGNGMAPTIKKGDIFKVDKRIKNFKRGDIVLYKIPFDKSTYFQRIIAIPNDKIEIKRNNKGIGEIYLNDKLLEESYKIKKKEFSPHPKAIQYGPVIIEKDKYFVLGDNRDLSYDSRFFGTLDKIFIKGKVVEIKTKLPTKYVKLLDARQP